MIYNIFDQSPKDKLFPLAKKKNIGIIARVPLDKVDKIKDALVNPKRTMAQIALKFCILDDGADVVIVGMRKPVHVEENAKSTDIKLSKK